MRRVFASVLLLAIAGPLAAQEARLLRFPAIHGDTIVFSYAGNLYSVPAKGGVARRLTSHEGYEMFARFSPDGKWIAYSSDESGRREVYVQGFAADRVPAAAVGKWQISTAGGDKPRWRHDGKELFYIAPDNKMMAVPVKLGPPFEPGVAVPLFETRVAGFFPYDVSPDGRFLLYTPSEAEAPASSPVTIVLNWQAELKH